METLIALFNY